MKIRFDDTGELKQVQEVPAKKAELKKTEPQKKQEPAEETAEQTAEQKEKPEKKREERTHSDCCADSGHACGRRGVRDGAYVLLREPPHGRAGSAGTGL